MLLYIANVFYMVWSKTFTLLRLSKKKISESVSRHILARLSALLCAIASHPLQAAIQLYTAPKWFKKTTRLQALSQFTRHYRHFYNLLQATHLDLDVDEPNPVYLSHLSLLDVPVKSRKLDTELWLSCAEDTGNGGDSPCVSPFSPVYSGSSGGSVPYATVVFSSPCNSPVDKTPNVYLRSESTQPLLQEEEPFTPKCYQNMTKDVAPCEQCFFGPSVDCRPSEEATDIVWDDFPFLQALAVNEEQDYWKVSYFEMFILGKLLFQSKQIHEIRLSATTNDFFLYKSFHYCYFSIPFGFSTLCKYTICVFCAIKYLMEKNVVVLFIYTKPTIIHIYNIVDIADIGHLF